MRVKVGGDCEAAKLLRGFLINASTLSVVESGADWTVNLRMVEGRPTIEGAEGRLESDIARDMGELVGHVVIVRTGAGLPHVIDVSLPPGRQFEGARAIFRALTRNPQPLVPAAVVEVQPEPLPEPPKVVKQPWYKRKLWLLLLILFPANVQAQGVALVKCHDGTSSFFCGDATNTALRVNLVANSFGTFTTSDAEVTATGAISAVCADPCASPETANSTVKLTLSGVHGGISIWPTASTLVGTLKCEESADAVNWVTDTCTNLGTVAQGGGNRGLITNPAALVSWTPNISPGAGYFRVRASAVTSGSATIYVRANNNNGYNIGLPFTSWPNLGGSGTTQVAQRVINLGAADATTTCNGEPCTQRVVARNDAPIGTEYSVLVRGNSSAATGTLTSACADPGASCTSAAGGGNGNVLPISMSGVTQVSYVLTAFTGTPTLTIKFEHSLDSTNGINGNWVTDASMDRSTFNRATGAAGWSNATISSTTPKEYSMVSTTEGAAWHRVRCSAFTSGSVTFTVRAATAAGSQPPWGATGLNAIQSPATFLTIGGVDASTSCNGTSCGRGIVLANTTPVGTEYGVIVRSTDGKAEDAQHTSGDVGSMSLGVRNDGGNTQTTSATGDYAQVSVDAYGAQWSRIGDPNDLQCTADNIGATLTELTGCAATASISIYITDMVVQSTTATGGAFTVKSGTGSNCGTNTTFVYPPVAGTAFAPANTNTTGPFQVHFFQPYKVTIAHALCVLGVVTNTTNILVKGYRAP